MTDRQTDRQKAMHKSPPCISTGGLKKLCKVPENHIFWPCDLDLWPMTLTFMVDPEGINVHVCAKFHDSSYYTWWDMNYCPVNFGQVTGSGQKVMHKSPKCISTGGLKNWSIKFHKIPILDKTSDENLMVNARGTDIWINRRARKPQNRAASGISCMEKGIFQKSLLQKGFLTQNRA